VDPVVTPAGLHYERSALTEHLSRYHTCPTTRAALRIEDCRADDA
jgi:hypothetical protein